MKYLLTLIFTALAFSVSAQVGTQPVQPPWYYYWPTENADNFQNSDLGTSSLGSGNLQRRSNIDVNKRKEEEKSPGYAPNQPPPIEADISQPPVNVNSRPASSSALIKWTDDKGVVHVTNDPNSVPDKYKDQINK